ncbi:unnamed protein product [Schistocephalus solidus]|uniref:Reverse transcriptase domain-containing protein n=1 Tax=Schistocephalus solidus TaxID=70667 RepID=A0A183T005_SCHSO|nr:unnamed protein product [Schistocephalus solidus]
MSISAEQFLSILQQQQTQFEAAHLKMMEFMMQQFSLHFTDPESFGKQSTSMDAVAACITEFIYDPDSGVSFDACIKHWEDIFHVEFAKADAAWKLTRLSFCAKTAPAIFQQTMDGMLTGTEGTAAYLDDIIVTGSN